MGVKAPYYLFQHKVNKKTIDSLDSYLKKVYEEGDRWHKELFPFMGRASVMREPKYKHYIEIDTELPEMAKEAFRLYPGSPHDQVENYMIDHDDLTVAAEVPIYSFFDNVSGHIDIIRFNAGKIEIWDFKNYRNYNVGSQLYWYRKLLAQNLNIPEEDIQAGFFTYFKSFILE
ncbi:MAG: hypothetical protein KO464_05595 [Candidatus Methanofastidiosum sp.]|nr:hypothetical protein [Methanofastidiosum sp.]